PGFPSAGLVATGLLVSLALSFALAGILTFVLFVVARLFGALFFTLAATLSAVRLVLAALFFVLLGLWPGGLVVARLLVSLWLASARRCIVIPVSALLFLAVLPRHRSLLALVAVTTL